MRTLPSYLTFQGSIGRRTFLLSVMGPFLLALLVMALVAPPSGFALWTIVAMLAWLWPLLAGGARRCHDRGRSGWFQLIALIPVVGLCWLFVELCLLPGKPKTNL